MKTDVEQAVAKNDDGGRDLYVLLLMVCGKREAKLL